MGGGHCVARGAMEQAVMRGANDEFRMTNEIPITKREARGATGEALLRTMHCSIVPHSSLLSGHSFVIHHSEFVMPTSTRS